MVQKEEQRRLGRPRQYDPEVALQRATEAFWDAGFSGTSLDDLTAKTEMNRPSLYAAFGDKEALYVKTVERYLEERRQGFSAAFAANRSLAETLSAIYERIIDRFTAGEHGARGCYLVGTAVTEAVQHPKVRQILTQSLNQLDEAFRSAFSAAQAKGELAEQADPRALATIASAVVHTLAFRARSGQPRSALRAIADSAVKLLCSPSRPTSRRRRRR